MNEKQYINQIMKKHKPWTVGIASRSTAKNFFYPVVYDKKTGYWFGYYKYKGESFRANIGGCRSGTARKYYIFRINGKPLNPEKEKELYNFLENANE